MHVYRYIADLEGLSEVMISLNVRVVEFERSDKRSGEHLDWNIRWHYLLTNFLPRFSLFLDAF